jgi:hypothetical protein
MESYMLRAFFRIFRIPPRLSAWTFLGVLVILIAGFPEAGHALDVTAVPSTVNIVPGVNNTAQLIYNGVDLANPNFISTSAQGRFETADGRLLGTVNRGLTMPIVNSRGTVAEFITIPARIIASALKLKQSRIFYRRVFDDIQGFFPGPVEVALPIVPASAGAFNLVRMALEFNQPLDADGTRPTSGGRITVPRFTKGLQAFATLTYNGGGTLRGQWKVDGQILRVVTQQLNPGLREIIIASPLTPSFPTYGTGLHKVEFEILDPIPGFDEPVIYYFVTEAYTGAPLGSLKLAEPLERAYVLFSPKQFPRFSWQPTGEDALYRFQLYRLDAVATFDSLAPLAFAYQKPLLAAVTKKPFYDLTVFDLDDIVLGSAYCWQVQAFEDNAMVGASAYRLVFFTGPAVNSEKIRLDPLNTRGTSSP